MSLARAASLVSLASAFGECHAESIFDPQRWTYNASLWWTSAVLVDQVDGPTVAKIAQLLTELTHEIVQIALRACLRKDEPSVCASEPDGVCNLVQIGQAMEQSVAVFRRLLESARLELQSSSLQHISLELAARVGNWNTEPGCSSLHSLFLRGDICAPAVLEVLECAKALSLISRLNMSKLHSEQIAKLFEVLEPPVFVESMGSRYEDVLVSLVRQMWSKRGGLRVAEIGVHDGHTSERLLNEFDELQILLVDPFELADDSYFQEHSLYEDRTSAAEASERLWEKMKSFRHRTVLVWQKSPGASAWVADNLLDLVFLDASHNYEALRADLDAWLPKLRRFGILAGHDYSLLWPGVCRAVREFTETNQASLNLGPDGLWWVRV
ncbi:Hypothetical protein SCF082_LOCUS18090 [Durusdinium trenchii]|uniref:Uncharacterized protein n=1 Tax=Durusdinium trenchii TaxID=1381693 RepID=A0ABP0KLU2_9DINO